MAGKGKDFDGIAAAGFERILRTKDAKDRFVEYEKLSKMTKEQRFEYDIQQFKNAKERNKLEKIEAKRKEQAEADETRFSSFAPGQREEWLKNKEIIDSKERGDYIKPGKEKEPIIEKVVEIITAEYGIRGEKVIDITGKVEQGMKVNNDTAGEDPCPRKRKNVYIVAIVDGIEGEYEFIERKKIIF